MRRVGKTISIARYITTYLIVFIVALSFVMTLFVNIFADRAIHYDIQGMLVREISQNNKNVVFREGKIKPQKDFEVEDDGIYFQIIGEKGDFICGKYPEGIKSIAEVGNQKLHTLEAGQREYYIIDRINKEMTKATGRIIYNRGIVSKSDIDSNYLVIKYITYVSILVFLILVFIAGLMMSKKIALPLQQMSNTAEFIGEEGTLSRRMQYDGKITELSILSGTNNRMLERVENMFETQKRFSSDVAHELRTPIAVLLAQCEYAKEHASTKEEFDEALEVIYRQTQKTNKVINQLLNLNRLENGRVPLEWEETDVDEIIRAICDEEEWKEEGNVRFELHLSGIKAELDIGLMCILLQNLIQNAVKYSEKPTTVKIFTEHTQNDIIIRVTDFECGIAEENLQDIFVPFYRVERSRNSEGFGLGLSLAKRITQIHGGDIRVESKLGQGSTFAVKIPRKRAFAKVNTI